MTFSSNTPVIIGIGEVKNKSTQPAHYYEPMSLMEQATELAIKDSNITQDASEKLLSSIDSIDTVRPWTWPYEDLPGLLAKKLGVSIKHSFCSNHGGNEPAKLLDEASRRVSQGGAKVALVTGGEALATVAACVAANTMPPPGWTPVNENVDSVFTPSIERMAKSSNLGTIHSVGMPIHVYPLYENAFRAHHGQTIRENNEESAQLYAEFAQTAAKNPFAWYFGKPPATKQFIGTVAKKNRMICSPYPLLMNAFNTVNLAAACLVTTAGFAKQLGVPEDRWVFPLGGAGTSEVNDFWERPNFHESDAIKKSIDGALEASGLDRDHIDLIDLYSCFPIVPKLGARHLGLPIERSPKPLTLLGGLTSFGGAGNNYSMHAIAAMVRKLRKGDGRSGLILANGGMLTYQHVICLSSRPRQQSPAYPPEFLLPKILPGLQPDEIAETANGEATIETYTVEFGRDGKPSTGHIVGRLKANGKRFVANHADEKTLQELASDSQEPIGRKGWVNNDADSCRNLFTFERPSKM